MLHHVWVLSNNVLVNADVILEVPIDPLVPSFFAQLNEFLKIGFLILITILTALYGGVEVEGDFTSLIANPACAQVHVEVLEELAGLVEGALAAQNSSTGADQVKFSSIRQSHRVNIHLIFSLVLLLVGLALQCEEVPLNSHHGILPDQVLTHRGGVEEASFQTHGLVVVLVCAELIPDLTGEIGVKCLLIHKLEFVLVVSSIVISVDCCTEQNEGQTENLQHNVINFIGYKINLKFKAYLIPKKYHQLPLLFLQLPLLPSCPSILTTLHCFSIVLSFWKSFF